MGTRLDFEEIVHRVNKEGYSRGPPLPQHYLTKILEYCEKNRQIRSFRHWNPHKDCEAVNRLAHNAEIIQIARKYFGAEPILWCTELKWSFPDFDPPVLDRYDGSVFHYDALDYRSLSVFVYLTDVDPDS